ncbi:hypothetical protein K3495_g3979 [Podosphaera aphanis]|nr:hypothetical protein K3495_g3979 [Podosphaera aphanis]
MFKWHVDATLGRKGRTRMGDLTKVVDGIAASLRNFSISAERSADEQPSRKTRSANAFAELASTVPRPARAATASSPVTKPSSPTARQIVVRRSPGGPQSASRSLSTPRKPNAARGPPGLSGLQRNRALGSGMRGGFNLSTRGGARRGAPGGNRGGARGGARGGRSRGTRARDLFSGPRKPRKKPWEEELEEPYTEEETNYLDLRDGGFTTPYIPNTSVQNLARHRPPVISSSSGFTDLIRYKLAVTTDNVSPQYRFASQHLMRVDRGYGTIFEDPEQRATIQEYKDNLDYERAVAKGIPYVREELGNLPEKTRNDIMSQWVAGHYEAPQETTPGNPTSYIRNYAKRNETWLARDAQKFEAKVASFMPRNPPQRSATKRE